MKKSIYGIQLIRIIACMMIVFHHMTDAFGIHLVNSLGRCAVTVFIVITGFLAGYLDKDQEKSYEINQSVTFWKRKIKKFYWVYFIAFIFKVILELVVYYVHPERIGEFPVFCTQSILYLTLTQIWVPIDTYYYAIVPACWYLSMSMVLYFLQPLLLSFSRKLSNRGKIVISILSFGVLIILTLLVKNLNSGAYIMYFFPLTRAVDFFIALNVGLILKQSTLNYRELNKAKWTFLEIVSLLLLSALLFTNSEIIWQQNVFYLPIALIVVSIFSQDGGVISNIASNKIILSFASSTYVIFIIHHVIYSYMGFLNKYIFHFSAWGISITSLFVTIISAYCLLGMKYIFERRFINEKN